MRFGSMLNNEGGSMNEKNDKDSYFLCIRSVQNHKMVHLQKFFTKNASHQ